MRKSAYQVGEDFEAIGEWWLPEAPEVKIYGTLRYSQRRIELELCGQFETIPFAESYSIGSQMFKDRQLIHGLATDQSMFSLFALSVRNSGNTTTYSVRHMIEGSNTANESDIKINSLALYCDYLEKFVDCPVLHYEPNFKDEARTGVRVTYLPPKQAVYRINAISAKLNIAYEASFSTTKNNSTINCSAFAELESDTAQNIEWYLTRTWHLVYLLTLLTDEDVSPTAMRIEVEGVESPCWLLYSECSSIVKPEKMSTPYTLFRLGHVATKFSDILEKWYSGNDIFLDSVHLTMHAMRNMVAFHRSVFPSVVQALEAFSRATTSGGYTTEIEYRPVKKALGDAIPATVSEAHKESLKSKIRYGFEYSLRARLRKLFESLSEASQKIVCSNSEKFIGEIVDTRNYLSHYTDELRQDALTGGDLYWAYERVLFLLRILMLRHVGIEETLIVAQMREHNRLAQLIALANRRDKPSKDDPKGNL